MVPVLGRPVMEHILRLLARHGFDDVIANLHYFPDLIRGRFGDGSDTAYGSSTPSGVAVTPRGCATPRHFGETFRHPGDALTDTWARWRHKEKGGI
jgi:mannose-1-phosphate guanylyltransferase/phosphomannomutase